MNFSNFITDYKYKMTQKTKEHIQKEIREIQKILTSLKLHDYKSKEEVQKLQQRLDKLFNQIEK